MNKIIGNLSEIVQDMIEGYLYLYGKQFKQVKNENQEIIKYGFVKRNQQEKVSIIIGGGAGNEPWSIGYVGDGMADGVISGNVYAAPSAISIYDISKQLYHKKGILYIGTNHMGDRLNFELARELLENDKAQSIDTRCLFIRDDIASDLENQDNRRGVAGICFAVKIAGAASELGCSLQECTEITKKAMDNIRTISVTTSSGYMPVTKKAMCELEEGMIEYGMGFNGEPGIKKEKLGTANHIVNTMMDLLLNDIKITMEDEVVLFINGLGGTSKLELFIVIKELKKYLENKKIKVYHMEQKDMFCPQETGGFSITIMKLDKELKKYYNYPVNTPLYYREKIE